MEKKENKEMELKAKLFDLQNEIESKIQEGNTLIQPIQEKINSLRIQASKLLTELAELKNEQPKRP